MKYTKYKRVFCEDSSQIIQSIKKSKYNGQSIIINGINYERIGDDLGLNKKTNLIEVLDI